MIDGAQYPDPRTAVEMKDPATQLTLVIEGVDAKGFVANLIPELATKPLAEVTSLPFIRQAFRAALQPAFAGYRDHPVPRGT